MAWIERLKGDFTWLKGALRALRMTTPIAKNPARVFPIVVEELAEKFGDAPALLSARERLSYRELGERSNRYARWARAQGLAKGETVCLLMSNRPEYMAIWLGITRAGGVVGTGAMLVRGGSVVIREKFSAREFWDDVVSWDCTLFFYIGELCRYLTNSPPSPNETRHRIRLCCGNGLRPDVWPDFARRFRIP